MKIITSYILKRFLYFFIIVLLALELFFVGLDLLSNAASLPQSANLKLLYIVFISIFALTITLPLAIVFGWIITIISFVKSNELVAFISLGAKDKTILFGPIVATLIILSILLAIQSSPLAYAAEYKSKILSNEYFVSQKNNVFFKFDNYFVYFEKLLPAQKAAENVTIFKVENKDMIFNIKATNGRFVDNHWEFSNVEIMEKPSLMDWENSKLKISHQDKIVLLEGFKPKILDTVYEPQGGYSVLDAIESFTLLNSQQINTNKIRASLYNQILIPLFIIPILLLIYFYTNINSRFFRVSEFASLFVFFTLIIWGAFFLLFRLSSNGVLIPELAMIIPLFFFFLVTLLLIIKKRAKI